jgi:hypothetical protein
MVNNYENQSYQERRYDSHVLPVRRTKIFSTDTPLALNNRASLWTRTSSLEHLIFTIRRCLQANDLPLGLTPISIAFLTLKFFFHKNTIVIKHVLRSRKLK